MGHDSHHGHDETGHATNGAPIENGFINGIKGLFKIVDAPVTFFRESIIAKFQTEYPYYHRNYPRVPTIDQCDYQDQICIMEAQEQYLRDRKVDKFVTHILAERARQCYIYEGHFDGFEKCRKLDEDHELAVTNYYIKYGDLGANANVIDAYMKQKHRLIWQRRNPDHDMVGLEKLQKEKREKVAKYQQQATGNNDVK